MTYEKCFTEPVFIETNRGKICLVYKNCKNYRYFYLISDSLFICHRVRCNGKIKIENLQSKGMVSEHSCIALSDSEIKRFFEYYRVKKNSLITPLTKREIYCNLISRCDIEEKTILLKRQSINKLVIGNI